MKTEVKEALYAMMEFGADDYSPEEHFKMKCEEEKNGRSYSPEQLKIREKYPLEAQEKEPDKNFDMFEFAERQRDATSARISNYRQFLTEPNEIEGDTLYKRARQYVKYLSDLIEGKYKESAPVSSEGLKSIYGPDKLSIIFERLVSKGACRRSMKQNFLSIFNDSPSGLVQWNPNITRKGLFDLMQRITDKELKTPEIKKYFVSDNPQKPIHGNWKEDKPGLFADEILKDL